MAFGRISGPLLKSNLTRDGVDLAFENNLVYLRVTDSDPNNHKVGIKNDNPLYTLDVGGTVNATTVLANSASFSSLSVTGNFNAGALYDNNSRVATVDGGLTQFTGISTSNLAEGTNLYFTTARARASLSASGAIGYNSTTGAFTFTQGNTDTVSEGTTNKYYTDTRARLAISVSGDLSYNSSTGVISYTHGNTDTVSEGTTNLYFTQARARAAISGTGSINYNNSTGVISYTQGNTDTVSEGTTNKYFTDARARAAISATGDISYNALTGVISYTHGNTDTVSEGTTNLYFTTARARLSISGSGSINYNTTTGVISYTQGNTDTVSEGTTNLYFTTARSRSSISTTVTTTAGLATSAAIAYNSATGVITFNSNTDNITEGTTNKYYTDTRARAALSASGAISYNSTTGAFTFTQGNTDTVSEGTTNKYYTDARARLAISGTGSINYNDTTGVISYTQGNTDTVSEGITNKYYTDARARAALSASGAISYNSTTGAFTFTQGNTDTVSEGTTNKYFTSTRARLAISVSGDLAYDSATGVISYTHGNTDTVSEGTTNLYFTTARARAALSASGAISYNSTTGAFTFTQGNTDTVSEGTTNKYYTDSRARAAISVSGDLAYDSATGVISYTHGNTDTVSEGSTNLYFTPGRARASLSASGAIGYNSTTGAFTFTQGNTDTVSEGTTNKYYTDARARLAISSSSSSLIYNSTTGVFSLNLGASGGVLGTMAGQDANSVTITGGNVDGTVIGATTPAAGTFTSIHATGDLTIDGNFTVGGDTVTINATTLSVSDNMIYLNEGTTVANPDLGFSGGYNDGTYHHTGLFRDATDGIWKFFQGYVPEPDASPYIDTADTSFAFAPIQVSGITAATGLFSGQLTSSVATGTAPFIVASTTLVTNLNADLLDGHHGSYYTTANNLTGTIPANVLDTSTLYIGTTAVSLARASAAQSLTGINSITLPGSTSGSVQIIPSAVAGSSTVLTLPSTSGTVITSGDTGTVTNTMLAGSIANSKLSNSSVTINGTIVGLGGTATITAAAGTLTGTTLNSSVVNSSLTSVGTLANLTVTNTITGSVSGNAGTVTNGVYTTDTGTVTNTMLAGSIANNKLANSSVTVGSTSIALGASATTLVGLTSVTSTTFTGALTGNASTASTLQTTRNINGVGFNGSADITITAAAGTLTGTTLNSSIVNSSLTSVGTLANLTVTNTITGSVSGNAGTVTNGVYTTGSYSNPAWITSLAYSKLTGSPSLATVATTGSYDDLINKPVFSADKLTSGSYTAALSSSDGSLNIPGKVSVGDAGGTYPLVQTWPSQPGDYARGDIKTHPTDNKIIVASLSSGWSQRAIEGFAKLSTNSTGLIVSTEGSVSVSPASITDVSYNSAFGVYYITFNQSVNTGLTDWNVDSFQFINPNTLKTWNFSTNGSITFPNGTVQDIAWTGVADYNNIINAPTIPTQYTDVLARDAISVDYSSAVPPYVEGTDYSFYGFIISNNNLLSVDASQWTNTAGRTEITSLQSGRKIKVYMPVIDTQVGIGYSVITINGNWSVSGNVYTVSITTSVPVQDFYAYTASVIPSFVPLSYNNTTGVFNVNVPTSDTIEEGTAHLYFTNERVIAALPDQSMHYGSYLTTDGQGNLSWQMPPPAFNGDYNSLTNKPTIPSIGNFTFGNTLTFPDSTVQSTAWLGTYSYNDLTDKPSLYSSAYIGTTNLDFTRSSASQTLTGVSIDGNAGTVTNGVYTTDTGTVTNTMLAGSIVNSKLLNSSVTINGTTISLGDSGTITADASTLTGTALKSTIVSSSLTSVGTLTNLTVTNTITGNISGNAGTVTNGVYTTDTGTVTNTMLAGSIANNKLANSTITINGTAVALGGSTTVTVTNQPLSTSLAFTLNGSFGTYDGSTAKTLDVNTAIVATLQDTQTLTNKSMKYMRIVDGSDPRKRLVFDITQLPAYDTGQVTSLIVPYYGGTLITADASNNLNIPAYSVGNSMLTNSSITINGTIVPLGGSITVVGGGTPSSLSPLSVGTGLTLNVGSTYDGTASRTISISSSVVTQTGSQTLTNKTISGASNTLSDIPNSALTNSAITINGTAVSLGGSVSGLATTAALNSSFITINGSNITLGNGISGLAATANNLTQFATTTSAELASIISGKTGTGSLVFASVSGTPTSGQALLWNGTTWTPGNVSASIGSYSIDALSDVDTTTVAPTTGQALVWDGSKWMPGDVSSSGGTTGGGTARLLDAITPDGSASTFELRYGGELISPTSSAALIISIDGVYQVPESAYTVLGSIITFAEAIDAGSSVAIVEQGGSGASALHELTDVNLSTLTDGQALVWSASAGKWINGSGGFFEGTATITTAGTVAADTFSATAYSTAKYLIQATAGSDIHSTELTVIHNGTTAYSVEYGTINTAELMTVAVSLVAGQVLVNITTAVDNATIDFKRVSIVSRLPSGFDLEGELMSGSGTVDLESGSGTYDLMGTTTEDMALGTGTEDMSSGTGSLDLMV